jgi:hypothetical protein
MDRLRPPWMCCRVMFAGGAVADRYATTRRRVRDQRCRVRISVTPRADQPRRCANRQPAGRVWMTPRPESSRRLRLTPASPRWGFLLTAASAIPLQRISEAGRTGTPKVSWMRSSRLCRDSGCVSRRKARGKRYRENPRISVFPVRESRLFPPDDAVENPCFCYAVRRRVNCSA